MASGCDGDSPTQLTSRHAAEHWDALDKVAMNKDVQELLKRIRTDLRAKEVRIDEYDKVLQPEELIASIRQAA